MAYYIYTQGNPAVSQAENLELAAQDEFALEKARYELLQEALRAYFYKQLDSTEVEEILTADPKKLPATIVARLVLSTDDCVMDSQTGLAMGSTRSIPPSENDTSFAVTSYEFYEKDGSEVSDEEIFSHLVIKHDFNRHAYQIQPADNAQGYREHHSLGYGDEGGNYQPVVTILAKDHPVRQAVETQAVGVS